ncbi:hypothetical protein ACJJIL_07395 [Microbulbifer sp. EKSA005]|uniref:hypothetical protein n=1 Tax=Microbulbifer sp. EKSA005 TaxID=3243364 RepID=UPI0040431624
MQNIWASLRLAIFATNYHSYAARRDVLTIELNDNMAGRLVRVLLIHAFKCLKSRGFSVVLPNLLIADCQKLRSIWRRNRPPKSEQISGSKVKKLIFSYNPNLKSIDPYEKNLKGGSESVRYFIGGSGYFELPSNRASLLKLKNSFK